MILTALVAFALQTPADLPAAIRALPAWCSQGERVQETWETADGHLVHLRRGTLECGLHVQPWRGDSDGLAGVVETALTPAGEGWYPVRLRDLVVNESGPMRWSEYEHRIAGSVLLIEPAEGQLGTVTLDIRGGD